MKSLTEKELEAWFKKAERTLKKKLKFGGLSKEEMEMQLMKIRLMFESQKTLLRSEQLLRELRTVISKL